MRNPFIDNIIIEFTIHKDSISFRHRWCDMCTLMKDCFYILSCLLERFVHHLILLGRHVLVIQSLYDECTAFDPVCMKAIISHTPEFRIIVKSTLDLLKTHLMMECSHIIPLLLG